MDPSHDVNELRVELDTDDVLRVFDATDSVLIEERVPDDIDDLGAWLVGVLEFRGANLDDDARRLVVEKADAQRPLRFVDLAEQYAAFVADEALAFEDLAAAYATGLTPPNQLVPDVIVRDQVTWLSGHPANGKTTVAMWVAAQHIAAGGQVIWLDFEGGILETLRRLQAVGAQRDDVEARFRYIYDPPVYADEASFARLSLAAELLPAGDLVIVFDSASKALARAGLDENDPAQVTRWTANVIMPLRRFGTVLVIDHVAKTATRSQPYARGAGSKLADAEVAWYVEATEPFNRSQAGELLLTKKKDRSGVLPQEVRLRVGDGAGGLPIQRVDGPSGQTDSFRDVKQRVVAALKQHGEVNASTLASLVKGKRTTILDAAKDLADDLAEPVAVRPGQRTNEVLYRYDPEGFLEIARRLIEDDS